MEWVRLEADYGTGVFSSTPGVWLLGRGTAKFRVFVPISAIAQIEYEKPADA